MWLFSVLAGIFRSEGKFDKKLEQEEKILKKELKLKKLEIKQESRLETLAKKVYVGVRKVERILKRAGLLVNVEAFKELERDQEELSRGEYSPKSMLTLAKKLAAELDTLNSRLSIKSDLSKRQSNAMFKAKVLISKDARLLEKEIHLLSYEEKEEVVEQELSQEEEDLERAA